MTNQKPTTAVTPLSLLSSMPAQFGVHLENMATISAVSAESMVFGNARFDLAGTAPSDLAEMTVMAINTFRTREDVRRLIVALWNPAEQAETIQACEDAALANGIDVSLFIVTGDTMLDHSTGQSSPLAGDDDPMVLRARTQTGAPVSQDELIRAWSGDGELEPASSGDRVSAVATFLALIEGTTIGDDALAELATALQDHTLRDVLLTNPPNRFDALSEVVQEAASRVGYPVIVEALRLAGARMTPGHRAPFWTMAGIIAHGAENTVPAAVVQIALAAAHNDEPEYRLASLASLAIRRGLRF